MTLRGPLQQLIERWRAAADVDWHKGHDDVEDGVWAYQHEANGAARARRKDADELSALLASVPEVSSSESRTILLEALIAARDTLIGFQKDAGRLPQGGYSTTMTDAERKLTQAVRDIDSIIDNEEALSALSDVPSTRCIGCGVRPVIGFTVERRPGPFCHRCWTALKSHVDLANQLNAEADRAERADVPSAQHGRDCHKVRHIGSGYLHDADDDRPYDVDGVRYCGRCHGWMDAPGSALPPPPQEQT